MARMLILLHDPMDLLAQNLKMIIIYLLLEMIIRMLRSIATQT
jgi:hypothetical protein